MVVAIIFFIYLLPFIHYDHSCKKPQQIFMISAYFFCCNTSVVHYQKKNIDEKSNCVSVLSSIIVSCDKFFHLRGTCMHPWAWHTMTSNRLYSPFTYRQCPSYERQTDRYRQTNRQHQTAPSWFFHFNASWSGNVIVENSINFPKQASSFFSPESSWTKKLAACPAPTHI